MDKSCCGKYKHIHEWIPNSKECLTDVMQENMYTFEEQHKYSAMCKQLFLVNEDNTTNVKQWLWYFNRTLVPMKYNNECLSAAVLEPIAHGSTFTANSFRRMVVFHLARNRDLFERVMQSFLKNESTDTTITFAICMMESFMGITLSWWQLHTCWI